MTDLDNVRIAFEESSLTTLKIVIGAILFGIALALVGEPASHEEFLDRCRDATRQMTFVTGARLLSGILTPRQAGEAYTAIAEATAKTAEQITMRRRRPIRSPMAPMVIIVPPTMKP